MLSQADDGGTGVLRANMGVCIWIEAVVMLSSEGATNESANERRLDPSKRSLILSCSSLCTSESRF